MKNYLKLSDFSLFCYHYLYIDKKDYKADNVFIRYQLPVKFGKEFHRKNDDYCFVLVKVKKKNEDIFLKSMKDLDNLLTIEYGNEYIEFKKEFDNILNECKEEK